MSNQLHKHWPTFKLIHSAKTPQQRKLLLQHYSKSNDFCSACREISKNLVKQKVIIKGTHASKLRRYKNLITKLARKNNSQKVKQRLVAQSSGWIGAVVPLIASIVGEIIRRKRG